MFNNNERDALGLDKMERVDIASFILQCQNYINDIIYETFIKKELDKIHQELQEIKNLIERKDGNGTE